MIDMRPEAIDAEPGVIDEWASVGNERPGVIGERFGVIEERFGAAAPSSQRRRDRGRRRFRLRPGESRRGQKQVARYHVVRMIAHHTCMFMISW
jgi:hypothetical protein